MNTRKSRTFSVRCKKLLQISLAIGLVVISLPTHPVRVNADNTENLLNIYGLTLGGPIKEELEEEISSIEYDIFYMKEQENQNSEYNAILQQYIEKCEAEADKITRNISVYQKENNEIAENISSNLLTMNIDELIYKDSTYKDNITNMDYLLSALDGYQIKYAFKSLESDLSDVEQKLEEVKLQYAESLDTYNLGDVKDIKWIMPNNRHVTSRYGYRVDPITKAEVRFHAGTDYRAPVGTPIGALFNGVVTSAGWSDRVGYFVTVQCGDNVKYFICHCSELKVEVGQEVKQYDTLALSGATGTRCTGPHLHLGLYLNGATYDVDKLFK